MNKQAKYLFIDRDGTIIVEPKDEQVDSIDKMQFIDNAILSLARLKDFGFKLVLVSNQDGLGTDSFPTADFSAPQNLMLKILKSQGIEFEAILICPHLPNENCDCRKPKIGLLLKYLQQQKIDVNNSYVIGDRDTDLKLADNLGIKGIKIGSNGFESWQQIANYIIKKPRVAAISRNTNETKIDIKVNLDQTNIIKIATGIAFFDHMLEQLIKHAGISAEIYADGDIKIDDHHTVEDVAIVLGSALKQALADKIGVGRYGFSVPMDEAAATVLLDLSGRAHSKIDVKFTSEKVGDLATEMIVHFFQSLADSMAATLHIEANGKNNHHLAEAMFKGVGRSLRQAITRVDKDLPTTKGIL